MERGVLKQDLYREEFANSRERATGIVHPRSHAIQHLSKYRYDVKEEEDMEPFIEDFERTLQEERNGFNDTNEMREHWLELTRGEKRKLLIWTFFKRRPYSGEKAGRRGMVGGEISADAEILNGNGTTHARF